MKDELYVNLDDVVKAVRIIVDTVDIDDVTMKKFSDAMNDAEKIYIKQWRSTWRIEHRLRRKGETYE